SVLKDVVFMHSVSKQIHDLSLHDALPILENQFKQSRFIEQIMVIGEGEKMPAALIQVNYEFIEEWAKRHHITFKSKEDIASNQKLRERIQEEIDEANKKF